MRQATKEEMLWLLDDTIEYYSKDVNRRCVKTNAYGNRECQYDPAAIGKEDVSEGCAIGRWMELEQKFAAGKGNCAIEELDQGLIPDKLSNMSTRFLSSIQNLHDYDYNWNDWGLSGTGLDTVADIRAGIQKGAYD